jgi:nitrous oxidase accessory protein NosD
MKRTSTLLMLAAAVALVVCTTPAHAVTDYGKQANPLTGPFPAYEIRYLSVTGAGTAGDPYIMYFEDRNNSSAFTRVVSVGDYNQFPATGTVLTGYSGTCHPTVYQMSAGNWIMYSNNCPSVTDYSLSTDGGVTWVGQGNLGLNTDNGAGIVAVYDDPIGGKVHFWYQDGGGNIRYCNSGAAAGDARYYSPDGTTEIVAFAAAESGVVNGFTPSGGIAVLPSGDYGMFLVAQDDSGVQLATSATLNAGAGSWTFLYDHSSPLLPKVDASLTPDRLSLKECSITDLGGGIFGIHYGGEFNDASIGDEDYGFAVADLNAPVHNVTQDTWFFAIQPAINAANPGDVIEVAAGTYAERLTLSTSVDLRGAQYGIDPTAGGARTTPANESTVDITGIGVTNPNVAVEIPSGVTGASLAGFTVLGSPTFNYSDESVVRCWDDNLTIEDNILDGYIGVLYKGNDFTTVNRNRMVVNKTGVVVQPNVATNVTITNNTIAPGGTPAGDAAGIYMTGVTTASVTGNVVSGFTGSRGCGGSNVTDVTISGNDLSGNKDGVSFWGTTTFVTIEDNDLDGQVRFGINIKGQDITIEGNDLSDCIDTGVNVDKHVIDTERVTIADNDLSGNTNFGVKVGGAVTETVDASGNYWGSTDAAAVKAEANGGVTCDYTPWLGGGAAQDPGYVGDFSELWVDDDSPQGGGGGGRIQEGVDLVTASTVNVLPGTYTESVSVDKAVALIGSGNPEVVPGAGSPGFDLAADDVTIQGFTIRDCKIGIMGYLDQPDYVANFGYSGLKLLDNTIYNTNGSRGFGIYLGTESERYDPSDPLGIYDPTLTALLDFTGLEIRGNEVYNTAQASICLQSMTSAGAPLEVAENDLHDGTYSALWIDASQEIDVRGNDMSANMNGIFLSNYGDGYYEATPDTPFDPKNIAVFDNLLRDNTGGMGVALYDGWPGLIDIYNNAIFGNASFGVYNYLTAAVDATYNWWGDPTGPFHGTSNPGGLGNAVSDYVTFVPLLAGNVVCDPDPLILNVASLPNTPDGEIDVNYLGGGSGLLYGYSMTVTWDAAKVALTGVTEGTLLSDAGTTQFFVYGTGNTRTIDCTLLGGVDGVTGPGTMFTLGFDAVAFGTSPVDLTIVAVRDKNNNPLTGFFEDDGEIQVDITDPVVTGAFIENLTLAHTDDFAKDTDNLELTATVTDDYGLTAADIVADLSGLLAGGGSAVAAESYSANVATWTTALASVTLTADGVKTVTITATDGLGNSGTDSDDIEADNTAPGAITGFAAAPAHEEVDLDWDDPSGLDTNYYGVRVQYDAWGDYPYYDTAAPSYPTDETTGDGTAYDATGVVTSTTHSIVPRDIHYYSAFAYDWALNYGIAAGTGQDRATNYWLGDVATTLGTWGYNGLVNAADIDKLGGTYAAAPPVGFNDSECDVGPTDDNGRLGIPEPDDAVQFEDLMIFAMNYGEVAPRPVPFLPDESTKALSLELSEIGTTEMGDIEIALRLDGNATEVKGLSALVAFEGSELELVSARLSDHMLSPLGQVFFWYGEGEGTVQVDVAVLGTDVTIGGSGEVALLTFRALGDEYALGFESADLRGVDNETLYAELDDLEARPEVPRTFRLVGNTPNPFNPMTKVAFSVPHESQVSVRVYDVTGRLVRTLVDGSVDPGAHEIVWDGRNDKGESVGSGVYFCTMQAGEFHDSHKMMLLK